MLRHKPERWIAVAVIACSLGLATLLAVILGHWEISPYKRTYLVRLPNCIGIAPNSRVSFAGAPVGRVLQIAIIPRGPDRIHDGSNYYVQLIVVVEKSLEIGSDAVFTVKQDGVLGAQFLAIMPGTPDSPPLPEGAVVYGKAGVDLMDVAADGRELLADLQPAAKHLASISAALDAQLPALLVNVDKFLQDGDAFAANLGSPDNRERLDQLLANLRVVSANLKVVSSNAKSFTATIGEKPWRLLWGGDVKPLVPEKQVLGSSDPVPISAK